MKNLTVPALILSLAIPPTALAQVGTGGWNDSRGNSGSFWYNSGYQSNDINRGITGGGGILAYYPGLVPVNLPGSDKPTHYLVPEIYLGAAARDYPGAQTNWGGDWEADPSLYGRGIPGGFTINGGPATIPPGYRMVNAQNLPDVLTYAQNYRSGLSGVGGGTYGAYGTGGASGSGPGSGTGQGQIQSESCQELLQ